MGQGFDCPRFGRAGSEWPVKRSTLKLPCQSSPPAGGPIARPCADLAGSPVTGHSPCQHAGIRRQDICGLRCWERAHKSDFSSTLSPSSRQFLTRRGPRVSGARCVFVIRSNLKLSRPNQHGLSTSRARGGSDSVLRIGARTGSHSHGLGGLEASNRLVDVGLGPRGHGPRLQHQAAQ